jgi:hypothetical protein
MLERRSPPESHRAEGYGEHGEWRRHDRRPAQRSTLRGRRLLRAASADLQLRAVVEIGSRVPDVTQTLTWTLLQTAREQATNDLGRLRRQRAVVGLALEHTRENVGSTIAREGASTGEHLV